MENLIKVEGSKFVQRFGIVDGNLAVILHEASSPKPAMLFVYDINADESRRLFIEMDNAKSKGGFFNANVRRLPVLTQKPVIIH
jgi:hypothetical protein